MIDDIVDRILEEARSSEIKDSVVSINAVMQEITTRLMNVMDTLREVERREKDGGNKGQG